MSEKGQSRPSHSAPVVTNVRYDPNSDHSRYECECPLSSNSNRCTAANRRYGWLPRSCPRTPAMSPMPQCSAHCPFFTRKISQEVKRRERPVGATPCLLYTSPSPRDG